LLSHQHTTPIAAQLTQTAPYQRLAPHLGLRGSAIFICAADEDGVVAPAAAVARVAVRGQNAADDVAQVGHVVDIWQRAGDLWVCRWVYKGGGGGGRRAIVQVRLVQRPSGVRDQQTAC
jgi:hypothetical protein